jgi:hypothetical protein
VVPQRLQHRLLLHQAIFVHEQPGPIAHHDHIVVESPRRNGPRVLAHEEGSVWLEVAQTRHSPAGFSALPGGKCASHVLLLGLASPAIDKEMPAAVGLRGRQPGVIGRAFVAQRRVGWQGIMDHHLRGIAEQRAQHHRPCWSLQGAVGRGCEVGDHHVTAAVDTILAGNHRRRIGRPHKGAAHGQPQQIRRAGRGLGQHRGVAAVQPHLAQEPEIRSGQGGQQRLWHTQRPHLAHLR